MGSGRKRMYDERDVACAKWELANLPIAASQVADRYGIARPAIYNIRDGKTYGDIAPVKPADENLSVEKVVSIEPCCCIFSELRNPESYYVVKQVDLVHLNNLVDSMGLAIERNDIGIVAKALASVREVKGMRIMRHGNGTN